VTSYTVHLTVRKREAGDSNGENNFFLIIVQVQVKWW